ncbi:MAG: three-Cys-motif partner protein TcmP [Hyphomicrobiales bacterium]
MPQGKFGGRHTITKLGIVEEYLDAYTHVLKNSGLSTVYFDAFAGTGDLNIDASPLLGEVEDVREFAAGSARRALRIEIPFERYVFNELKQANVVELEALREEFPLLAPRISIVRKDANEALLEFCDWLDHKPQYRAVIFLDPFGNEVKWTTISRIARTKRTDLWYLFPVGLGIGRQIGRDGAVLPEHGQSIDELLGTTQWRSALVAPTQIVQADMFVEDQVNSVQRATADQITQYVIGRMKTEFAGGVLDVWIPLGRGRAHWYSLLFAWANPRATDIAKRIAGHLIRRARHGRPF